MPAGRPTKYNPDMCDNVIAWGSEGLSKTEIACNLKICRDTLYRWCEEHEEFSDAIKRAEQEAEAWYMRTFKGMAQGGYDKAMATPLIFAAKNQLPKVFRDQHHHDIKADITAHELNYLGYQEDEDPEDSESQE